MNDNYDKSYVDYSTETKNIASGYLSDKTETSLIEIKIDTDKYSINKPLESYNQGKGCQ